MDIRKVKKLIELLEESGIAELEIHEGEESVRISRWSQNQVAVNQPVSALIQADSPSSDVIRTTVRKQEKNTAAFFYVSKEGLPGCRPTKAEMTAEVQKVYPTAVVMYFNPSMVDPTKPMLFAGQET